MFKEDAVVTLPGEVTVTSPKEVGVVGSELSVGENGGTVDIYNTNGKGSGFGGGRYALSFIVVGTRRGKSCASSTGRWMSATKSNGISLSWK